jgi:hypothetical protein
MINFTDLPMRKKAYAGANGSKISVVYEGVQYMLKFPPHPTKNNEMSYSNSCICEHIGCKIFESVGIPVQNTILGIYTTAKGDRKVVVACKDFTTDCKTLQDFASLKNQIIDSDRNGYGTELSDILLAFGEQNAIDPQILSDRFWDMFIVDAFIGNWDRHNGNWGFLYDTKADEMTLAPVFDCGSSLYPQADESLIEKILRDEKEINYRIFEIPTSAIKHNDSRINYFKFISSLKFKDCNRALKRITARIDMSKINAIIDETPFISDLYKNFYKTMLAERKEHILDHSLTLLRKKERQKEQER